MSLAAFAAPRRQVDLKGWKASGERRQAASFVAVSGVACRVSLRSPRHPTLTLGS